MAIKVADIADIEGTRPNWPMTQFCIIADAADVAAIGKEIDSE